jgi:2-polyprenyl-6-methoxyphenol hydroxylase-like FAD-dependent oxidoreductase
MLGYLLARTGAAVTVLEKHKDFFRDFRGDTVHPSTLEVMHELGILEDFLKVPHQKVTHVSGVYGGFPFTAADFRSVPTHCKFVALMPQWDFLDFLSGKAKQFPSFSLRLENEATDIITDGGVVRGVIAQTPDGPVDVRADLVVGCDGRHSRVREVAGFQVEELGVPIDVLWFRLGRSGSEGEALLGNLNYGRALVLIPRGDYFQAGLIVPKGSFEQIQQRGLQAFRDDLLRINPGLGDCVNDVQSWDHVKLLSVQINRLLRWHRPGLLCIGDAAHAMSPAGGVGINLAIQDAVATANILADPLRQGRVTDDVLARVQRRREFPTRATQFMQVNAHKAFQHIFRNEGPATAPWQLKVATSLPGVQHLTARIIGVGVLPEHIAEAKRPACDGQKLKKIAVAAGLGLAALAIGIKLLRRPRKRRFSWA